MKSKIYPIKMLNMKKKKLCNGKWKRINKNNNLTKAMNLFQIINFNVYYAILHQKTINSVIIIGEIIIKNKMSNVGFVIVSLFIFED